MEGQKERQGDFVFTAQNVGEYRFCFNNEMSTFADKMVDFEVAVSLGFNTPYTKTHTPVSMCLSVCDWSLTWIRTPHSRSKMNPNPPSCLRKQAPALNNTRPSKTPSSKSVVN